MIPLQRLGNIITFLDFSCKLVKGSTNSTNVGDTSIELTGSTMFSATSIMPQRLYISLNRKDGSYAQKLQQLGTECAEVSTERSTMLENLKVATTGMDQ